MAPRKRKRNAQKSQKPDSKAKHTKNTAESPLVSESAMSSKDEESDELPVAVSESSDESNWEEVEDAIDQIESDSEREPIIPKEGVEITIEVSKDTKRKRKAFDLEKYFQKQFLKLRKEVQEAMHKVHLLCLVAHYRYVNRYVNRDVLLRGVALSIIPIKFLDEIEFNLDDLKRFVAWFSDTFTIVPRTSSECRFAVEELRLSIENGSVSSEFQLVLVLSVVLTTLRVETRLITSLQPVPLKISIETKEKPVKESEKKVSESSDRVPNEPKRKKPISKSDRTLRKTHELKELPKRRSLRLSASKSINFNDDSDAEQKSLAKTNDSNSSDDDFEVSKSPNPRGTSKSNPKDTSKSPDSQRNTSKVTNDHWIEVYLESENRWVCVDCVNGIIDHPHEIESHATQPVKYVIAVAANGSVKDVTKRYSSRWLSHTRKIRVDSDWWNESLAPFRPPLSKREESEDKLLEKELAERPLPTAISDFKNHPLYALKRHLLKFEAIYPPDTVPVGFVRGEPIYPRSCIHNLHSRETWLKEARLVKLGETTYKVVKARPKWNKAMGELQTDIPLELFGEWQTADYVPPIAENGKVPRNDYGNVELFKPTMLPQGTVHLQIPGLNRVARKLSIDCAPAMVGWDFHGVGSHPTYDGWVVCEEFKDVLLDAWNEEQILIENREREKREKRIYGNWRRIIKGLLIRERLNLKYRGVEEPSTSNEEKTSTTKQKKTK